MIITHELIASSVSCVEVFERNSLHLQHYPLLRALKELFGRLIVYKRAEAVSDVDAATTEAIYGIKRAETVSEVDAATSEPAV